MAPTHHKGEEGKEKRKRKLRGITLANWLGVDDSRDDVLVVVEDQGSARGDEEQRQVRGGLEGS